LAQLVAIDEGGKMSNLPIAERPPKSEPYGAQRLLQSIQSRVISAVGDANLIVVLIVFIIVCLLALNLNVIAPDANLTIAPFGPYP
jgi:hypothetical protein